MALRDSRRQQALATHLCQLAPAASIRHTDSLVDMVDSMEHWHPVLVIMEFTLSDGCIVPLLEQGLLSYRAPFMVGIADGQCCEEVARAMRCGVSYVVNASVDEQRLETVLTEIVLEPACLEHCVCSMVNPLLYSDDEQLDLKKLSDQFEHYIFTSASAVTTSKNGLARLLGISRQLVQYHLKKKDTANPHFQKRTVT